MTYIDPRGKVLAHVDRITDWRRGFAPAPVTVEWDLSNRCSLGCQACHFAHTHTKGPWTTKARTLPMAFAGCGDLADMAVVRAAIDDMARAGVRAIVWSGGGEPTLHPQWMDAIQAARDAGLEQGMYTLGGHLSETSGHWLATQVRWVVVSLDAADAATYAAEKGVPPFRFEDACQGVRWLATGSAVVGVSFLLHAGNFMQAGEMLALARRLGATYATFRPAIETRADRPSVCEADRAWITAALPSLRALASEPDVELHPERFVAYRDWAGHGYSRCAGIQLNATVTPDGRMWVCPQRRGSREGLLGDLSRESFRTIWSRHPGVFHVNEGCRVLCRLHPVNQQMEALAAPRPHEAFV